MLLSINIPFLFYLKQEKKIFANIRGKIFI